MSVALDMAVRRCLLARAPAHRANASYYAAKRAARLALTAPRGRKGRGLV